MGTTTLKQSIGTEVDHQRDTRLVVRLTVVEKRKFEKMAKDRHTDISELTRQLLHKEADAQTERA